MKTVLFLRHSKFFKNYYVNFGEYFGFLRNEVNAKENRVDTWGALIPEVTA